MLDFAAEIIELAPRLHHTVTSKYVAGQLVRSASSAGANFQEARGAESRADFAHKIQIVLKELRESEYWLKLLQRTKLAPASLLPKLLTEADELIRIAVKSVVTVKSRS